MSPQVQALVQEAQQLQSHGNVIEAVRRCRKALRLEPGNLALSALMGTLLAQQGELQQAARFLGTVAQARPQDADTQFNLGIVLQGQGRHPEALERLVKSIALRGESADVLAAIALSLQETGKPEEAVEHYQRALRLEPRAPRIHNDLGNALQDVGRHEEALPHYLAALDAAPRYPVAHNNLGNALSALGRFTEATESYRRALELDPDNADAHYYLGLTQLLLGDYAQGLKNYEYRLKRPERGTARTLPGKRWSGTEDLRGKSILLHAEQGLGDTLQFARYAALVAAKGAKVTLEVYAPLAPLMHGMQGVERLVVRDEPLPACDLHCPLPSLPLAFQTTVDSVPPPVAYRPRGARKPGVMRVGLCWKGNVQYVGDRRRSIPIRTFEPILRTEGVELVSLHKDLSEEETQLARACPNFSHQERDFQTTAGVIAGLDLVITVDTAWGHWAGSVGTPVWVLLNNAPYWPWLLEREDSPWYPSARLFRQRAAGDWGPVVEQVAQALGKEARRG